MKFLLITMISFLFVSCASYQSERVPASEKIDEGITAESYMMGR